jgi:hypothetical protein
MIQATRKVELLQRLWEVIKSAAGGEPFVGETALDDYTELLTILSGDPNSNGSVLQNWLVGLPIRMQSTLILGLRGPDGYSLPCVKEWVRWLRGLAFKPGNPDNVREFMHVALPTMLVEKGPLARELETLPQHFYSHLMHAVQVVGVRHPDASTAEHARQMFEAMADLLHLTPEPPEVFEQRLCHREWPGGGQPDTALDAVALLDG